MSASRNKLEQILELLLNEDSKKAEEMLHEYVVAKAREEYERVLDEADVEESGDKDFEVYEDDIDQNEELGEAEGDEMEYGKEVDQTGDFEDDVMAGDEESDEEFDHHADVGGEEDFEDRVTDLEAELEDLRAEFEALMSDEESDVEMDMDDDGEDGNDDGDDETGDDGIGDDNADDGADEVEFGDEDEGIKEATQFSKKTTEQPMKGGSLKGSEEDSSNSKSPYTNPPKHTTISSQGEPVVAKDGGEGKKNHGGTVKNDSSVSNMNVKTSSKGSGYGSGMKKPDMGDKNSPLTKRPQ